MNWRMLSLALCAALGLTFFSGYTARADDLPTDDESGVTLHSDDVYVTAGKVAQELLDVPMSVSVVTEEDIRRSADHTIGGLLRDVPGVELVSSGGQGFNRIKIRGENPNRVLILIDGQKIAENKSMDGTALLIDPARVERIEVIRGPASVLYGSEAIGGVVNIITKKGGKKPVEGSLSAFWDGANDGYGGSASIAGNYEGWKYRISGAYGDHNDRRTPDGRANNSDYLQKDTSVFLGYGNDKMELGAGYEYFESHLGAGSREPGYSRFRVDVPEWKREKYYAFTEFKNITDWFARLRLDVFYQENTKLMNNHVDVDGMPMVMDIMADNLNRQFGFSAQADWQVGENNYLITGYEFNNDDLKADGTSRSASPIPSPAMNYSTITKHDGTQKTNALFAQMETTLPSDFTLTYGVRYTWVKSTMHEASGTRTNAFGTTPSAVGDVGSSDESRPVFGASLMWSGIENMTWRISFSQGFRVPTLQEQYVQTTMGGEIVLPNSDLTPEKSNNYELGVRYSLEKLNLDATVFYSDADDYISTQRIDSTTVHYVNVSKAETHGLEFSASYDLPYGFTPYASGTWMRRKFDFGDHSTWHTGTPDFFGRAGLRYATDLGEDVGFYADAYGRFSTTSKDEDSSGEIVTYDAWETANFGFGFEFGDERQYSVNAELLNLFDTKYKTSDAILEPGFHANINFSMKF